MGGGLLREGAMALPPEPVAEPVPDGMVACHAPGSMPTRSDVHVICVERNSALHAG